MRDAKLENLVICYPVKRNLYGKIFGGYLMRTAYETALSNASILSKCTPQVMAADSVVFRKSVEIGSLLLLSSQVCYSTNSFMQLSVNAEVLDVANDKREVRLFFSKKVKAIIKCKTEKCYYLFSLKYHNFFIYKIYNV